MIAVWLVRTIARTGVIVLPGALLLSGVAVNLFSAAGVLTIQYLTDPTSALRILRWLIGSLDVVGLEPIWRMSIILVPAWIALLAFSRQLNLLSIDEDTAATLGVNVRRVERIVYALSALIVGVTVSAGGAIGFVGLIVPHAVRLMFGEDLRIVLPGSLLLGASFLILPPPPPPSPPPPPPCRRASAHGPAVKRTPRGSQYYGIVGRPRLSLAPAKEATICSHVIVSLWGKRFRQPSDVAHALLRAVSTLMSTRFVR